MKSKRGVMLWQKILHQLSQHKPLIATLVMLFAFIQMMNLINNAKITGESAIINRLFSTPDVAR